jgi:hypothetical protein
MSNRGKNLSAKEWNKERSTRKRRGAKEEERSLARTVPNHVSDRNQALSIVASSTSMMGMSSFTAYTRWHCVHFKLSGFCR